MTTTLFISDLHLSKQRPAVTRLFLHFLEEQAGKGRNLYILGDLFDAWIGDDDDSSPVPEIRAAMKAATDCGLGIYLMHGNRDFLIGERFAAETGCSLLRDPHLIELGETSALLMHGDLLCSDDLEYHQARKFLRSPDFIADFLQKSVVERIALAAEYRKRSGEVISLKSADIMDVNQKTVEQYMLEHNATLLIHGHTHRPDSHAFNLGNKAARRIVLGDWGETLGPYLKYEKGQLSSLQQTP